MIILNLSFTACGFMGIYHLGAVGAFLRHGDELACKRNPATAKLWVYFMMMKEIALIVFFRDFHVVFFSGSWCSTTTGEEVNRIFKGLNCLTQEIEKCNQVYQTIRYESTLNTICCLLSTVFHGEHQTSEPGFVPSVAQHYACHMRGRSHWCCAVPEVRGPNEPTALTLRMKQSTIYRRLPTFKGFIIV